MKLQYLIWASSIGLAALAAQACTDDGSPGASSGAGGAKTGGNSSAGAPGTGGKASGGAAATGGNVSGGAATGGGAAVGGAGTGGGGGMAGSGQGGAAGMAGVGNQAGAGGSLVGAAKAEASVMPITPATLTGTAVFQPVKDGEVKLKLDVTNCPEGAHAVHLHINGSCTDPGLHWIPNGEGIGTITCNTGMVGVLNFTRTANMWEVNTGGANDVTNYTIVIHLDPDGGTKLACGEINPKAN